MRKIARGKKKLLNDQIKNDSSLFSKGKEHSLGKLLISFGFSTTKILSKLNMGAVTGQILCNTFWTAQGSL